MMNVQRNPFYYGSAIKQGQLFTGRQQEISAISEAVSTSSCISIVGERRVGKTSLLLHFLDPVVQQQNGLNPTQYIFTFFDFQGYPTITPTEFWYQLLSDIRKHLFATSVLMQQTETLLNQKEIGFADVENWFKSFQVTGLRLVILFDEFDIATANPNFTLTFFSGLRKLAYYSLSYIVASHRPLSDLYFAHPDALGSHFFNIFRRITLGGFTVSDVEVLLDKALVGTSITFDTSDRKVLNLLADSHPFFLQIAAYFLFDAYRYGHHSRGQIDYIWVQEHIRDNAIEHFRYYWDNSEIGEQLLLATFALLDPNELDHYKLYPQSSDLILHRLQERVLIVKDQQNKPRIFSTLFEDWVAETVSFVPIGNVESLQVAIKKAKAKGFQKAWLDTTERIRKGFAWIDLKAIAKWLVNDKAAQSLIDLIAVLLKLKGS
jgi:uncharacterized protein